jgi:L-lysine 2,3-aminomutase
MIARTPAAWQPANWQEELASGYRDSAALLAALGLRPEQVDADLDPTQPFPLRVPAGYVRRMRRGDPADPLLRQVLPLGDERATVSGFVDDPVADRSALHGAGVLRKYHGRALLITTGACAIHCRYCFRRHFPYAQAHAGEDDWRGAIDAIDGDPSISEVILSGGDPLVLSTQRLAALVGRLAAIPHLRRLRVHTRLPVVLPSRIDAGLLELLTGTRLKPVLVVHANHPNEIDAGVIAAAGSLSRAGIALFNQSVLLRGVNDDAETLATLSETLFDTGITPYYLHQLDRVTGAAHFEVPDTDARSLYHQLQSRLPGYLVPRLVREIPGASAKQPLGADKNSSLF